MLDQRSAVDELLQAEESANKIIKNAHKEKERKIKEARQQAGEEIQIYRKEKEQEYQQLIQQQYGNQNDENQDKAKLTKELLEINDEYEKNQQKVVNVLVQRIMDVEISVPQVMKGNFEEYFKKN